MSKVINPKFTLGWAYLVTTVAFLLALAFNGYESDINFWQSWMAEFASGGYAASSANYPPLLLHWMYLGGSLIKGLGINEAPLSIIKLWVQIPVWACWIVLVMQVGRFLRERGIDPLKSVILWLVCLNPAILLDNPMWGQVDLLVALPLSLAFLAYAPGGNAKWGLFWLSVALLTKFQAIVFVPLIGGLAVRHFKDSLKGIIPAIAVFFVGFSPFILVGHGYDAMERAYWGNVGIYPYATYNAANLWQLIVGNEFPRNQGLFTHQVANSIWEKFFTPSGLGVVLFGLVSLWVFYRAIKKGEKEEWRLALLSFVGFFAFSSDMHERYLFSAVPLAALWAAKDKDGVPWFHFCTWVVFANIAFLLRPEGWIAWKILSILILLGFIALLFGTKNIHWASHLGKCLRFYQPSGRLGVVISFVLVAFVLCTMLGHVIFSSRISLNVGENIYLSDYIPMKFEQSWLRPQLNLSMDGKRLKIVDQSFDHGIGAHAHSQIYYSIPEGKYHLQAKVGIDAESSNDGKVQFIVECNQKKIWTSRVANGGDSAQILDVDFEGPCELDLILDPLGSDYRDHGDWADLKLSRLQ